MAKHKLIVSLSDEEDAKISSFLSGEIKKYVEYRAKHNVKSPTLYPITRSDVVRKILNDFIEMTKDQEGSWPLP